MENPFEVILERLDKIESLLEKLQSDEIAVKNKEEKFLSPQEAADFLGDALATLYGRTSKNEIPFYKRGKKLYFKKSELIEWIEAGKCKTIDELIKTVDD
ncbi:MAG: DNA-binding protein [Rickettsiales bacterium]|nr:DNA-binding protein [Rickettsiales bacterium]